METIAWAQQASLSCLHLEYWTIFPGAAEPMHLHMPLVKSYWEYFPKIHGVRPSAWD